jgi:hypothetical protein
MRAGIKTRPITERKPAGGLACFSFVPLHLLPALLLITSASDAEISSRERVMKDREAKKPLVAHVVVALADNDSQGIVKIPSHLGDGDDPAGNLYWGARYGLRTFLSKSAGWSIVQFASSHPEHVLERIVLKKQLAKNTVAYVVADAWRGENIGDAIQTFTRMAAGHDREAVFVQTSSGGTIELNAGGSAHVVAYLGHNGLMEITVSDPPPPPEGAAPRSTIVLACISGSYFEPFMKKGGAHFLLATRGLMAPESYTFDAALTAWFLGRSGREVKTEAASAYCRYQKCSQRAGNALFATQ